MKDMVLIFHALTTAHRTPHTAHRTPHTDVTKLRVWKGVQIHFLVLLFGIVFTPNLSFSQCNIAGTPLTITGAVTWNTSNTIYTNVIVSSGATLTISGSSTIIKMCQSAQIFVKGNGRLVIKDYAEVTCLEAPSKFWTGVLVEGDDTQTQATVLGYCPQGKFDMTNHGVISYAKVGVFVSNVYGDFIVPYDSGGIVKTNSGHFINCFKGIVMGHYSAPPLSTSPNNLSSIIETEFRWDAGMYEDPSWFYLGVATYGIKGMNIKGCEFNSGLPQKLAPKVKGIFLADSEVSVIPNCTSLSYPCTTEIPCTFYGMDTGVETIMSQSLSPTIHKCEMYDSRLGVVNNDGFFTRITRNNINLVDINVIESIKTMGYRPIDGINSEDAISYIIEQNNIQVGPYSDLHRGIVNFSRYKTNVDEFVYNNTVEGIHNEDAFILCGALWAEGSNNNSYFDYAHHSYVNPENYKGLQYLCNKVIDNSNHIISTDSTGIRIVQGNPSAETGNRFINNNPVHTEIDNRTYASYNPSGYFIYYSNHFITDAWPTNITPGGSVTVYDETDNNKCPLNFVDDVEEDNPHGMMRFADTTETKNQYLGYRDEYKELNETLESYIDNGNTEELINAIQNAQESGELSELYLQLIEISPYLSTQILKDLASANIFSKNEYMDLFVINPETCANGPFVSFLRETELNFSEDDYEILLSHQHDVSARGQLRGERDIASFNMDQSFRKVVYTIKSDEFASVERVEDLYKSYPNHAYIYALAESLLYRNAPEAAEIQIEDYLENHIFVGDELLNLLDYISLFNVLKGAYQDQRNVFELNELELSQISEISQRESSYGQGLAKTIYCKVYNRCGGVQNEDLLVPRELRKPEIAIFSVFPNPSFDYLSLSLDLSGFDGEFRVQVIDVKGSIQLERTLINNENSLDVSRLSPGIYFVRGIGTDGIVYMAKFKKL